MEGGHFQKLLIRGQGNHAQPNIVIKTEMSFAREPQKTRKFILEETYDKSIPLQFNLNNLINL